MQEQIKKPSEIFEGENSSLRKTYEEAVEIEQEIMEMFDKEFFYLKNLKVTHYHGEDYEKAKLLQEVCNNTEDKLKSFISYIITLVQKRKEEEMVEKIWNIEILPDTDANFIRNEIIDLINI